MLLIIPSNFWPSWVWAWLAWLAALPWLLLAVAGCSCLVSVVSGFLWFFLAVFGHSLPWLALACPGELWPRLGCFGLLLVTAGCSGSGSRRALARRFALVVSGCSWLLLPVPLCWSRPSLGISSYFLPSWVWPWLLLAVAVK